MTKKITQELIDKLQADTEHQKFLDSVLDTAIKNGDVETVYAVMYDEGFTFSYKKAKDRLKNILKADISKNAYGLIFWPFLEIPKRENKIIRSTFLEVMEALTYHDLINHIVTRIEEDIKNLDQKTQDERVDRQIQFKANMDLNEAFVTLFNQEQFSTDDEQIALEIIANPNFTPLPTYISSILPAIIDKSTPTLSSLASHDNFRIDSLLLLDCFDIEEIYKKILKPLLFGRHKYGCGAKVLEKMSQSPTTSFVFNTALGLCGAEKLLLTTPLENLRALKLNGLVLDSKFADGHIPFYKPAMNMGDYKNYETPITYAIKRKYWDYVELYLSRPSIDLKTKVSQGGNVYKLLQKAAKTSLAGKGLLRIAKEHPSLNKKNKKRSSLTSNPGPG